MEPAVPANEPTSRPSKIARRDALVRAVDDKVAAKRRLYFDLLKNDESENIVRYLSARPTAKNWSGFIDEKDVSALYTIDGELGGFNRAHFQSIILLPPSLRLGSNDTNDAICIRDINLARKIIEQAGENFTKLRVDWDCAENHAWVKMLNDLSPKLLNIVSIIIREGEGSALLKTLGKRLKSLELALIHHDETAKAVSLYCPNIQQLIYTGFSVTDLNKSNIWKTLGNTLRVLSIRACGNYGEFDEFDQIQKYCHRLGNIDIYICCCCFEKAAALLKCVVSYKERLQHSNIHNFSLEQVQDLVESCTKARFNLQFTQTKLPVQDYLRTFRGHLETIGKQLDTVEFDDCSNYDAVDLAPGWNSCPTCRKSSFVLRDVVEFKHCFSRQNAC